MQTAVTAFAIVWCLAVLFFMMYRMWKAHQLRIGIMKDDLDAYARLPSYAEMVFKFWRPLSSFVEESLEDTPRGEPASLDNSPRRKE
jgi:hypothetical protein